MNLWSHGRLNWCGMLFLAAKVAVALPRNMFSSDKILSFLWVPRNRRSEILNQGSCEETSQLRNNQCVKIED
jgi:hypothetical protein